MTQSSEWYAAMATRIKERDHAINMIGRWQAKLDSAEIHVKALSNGSYDFEPQPEVEVETDELQQHETVLSN